MARSRRTYADTDIARKASEKVAPWLAFRFLFAQQYNAHHPQGSQYYLKSKSAEVASAMIEVMGGAMMAPPPPGFDQDEDWTAFITVVKRIPRDVHPCLMRSLVDAQEDQKLTRQMVRLHMLMIGMRRQQESNNAGWVPGVGFRPRRKRRKR